MDGFVKLKSQLQIFLLVLVFAGLSAGEALWWNNARSSYPRSLVSPVPASVNDLASLREACGKPLEIEPQDADMVIARCGTFWPLRAIWLVPKAQVAEALQ
jgi:hypothetical protein